MKFYIDYFFVIFFLSNINLSKKKPVVKRGWF